MVPFNSLWIVGKRFRVDAHDKPLMGECDSEQCRIGYRVDQDRQQLQDTLLHEAMHGIDHAMGLKLRERQVAGLATGLIALIRDNPKMADWLLKRPE